MLCGTGWTDSPLGVIFILHIHTEYLPGQLHCATQVTASVFTYSNM
jgi:hypothetical protein